MEIIHKDLDKMGEVLIGCSGWSYPEPSEKGGWTGAFYPDSKTKRLQYYAEFFGTAEMDSSFYEKFYKFMTRRTFEGMVKATPKKFQFSVKVPETVTHDKRLNVDKGAITLFEEFLDKISPLKTANKLGSILIQLPPSFSVREFSNTERFLDRLPKGYDYALEFRHPSWETEGPWDMLKHYNIATVLIDSPAKDNLKFLSEVVVTANHSFVRWHGRDSHHRYNYLYSEEELKPWIGKIKKMQMETSVVRGYFNNHYGAKAVVNALLFKEMIGESVSDKQRSALEHAQTLATQHNSKITSFTNSN
jgi:uncharacterized protein YecE (DUF72 family)